MHFDFILRRLFREGSKIKEGAKEGYFALDEVGEDGRGLGEI